MRIKKALELFRFHYDDCSFPEHDDKLDWARQETYAELDSDGPCDKDIEQAVFDYFWELKQKDSL